MNEIIIKENDRFLINGNLSKQIADFESEIKKLKEKEEKLKELILTEMEEKGILSVESDDLKITYVGETYRENFDIKKFRQENPDEYRELYMKYGKDSHVKSSIRIKVKEQEEDE